MGIRRAGRVSCRTLRQLGRYRLSELADPVEQIVGFAKSENIDLIAMPTHGYGVFRQILIGSVTAKILHDVDCTVLTGVHLQERPEAEFAGFSQILAAIDLDSPSSGALQWASQLAARFHAKLGIVHAAPSVRSASPAGEDKLAERTCPVISITGMKTE